MSSAHNNSRETTARAWDGTITDHRGAEKQLFHKKSEKINFPKGITVQRVMKCWNCKQLTPLAPDKGGKCFCGSMNYPFRQEKSNNGY